MLGIFDSGVGGLTVVKEIEQQVPTADLIFFGDTARAPYGTKGVATIRHFATEAVELLKKEGATAFVVACHTMSAVALGAIKVAAGSAPVFDVVSATVNAVKNFHGKSIGVIGTRATIASKVYEAAFAPQTITTQACPLLVPLIEEGWTDRPETKRIVRSYLAPLQKHSVDTLILGCTHYPLIQKTISAKMGTRVHVIDPSNEVGKMVAKAVLLTGTGKRRYLFSDVTSATQKVAEKWLGHTITIEQRSAEKP